MKRYWNASTRSDYFPFRWAWNVEGEHETRRIFLSLSFFLFDVRSDSIMMVEDWLPVELGKKNREKEDVASSPVIIVHYYSPLLYEISSLWFQIRQIQLFFFFLKKSFINFIFNFIFIIRCAIYRVTKIFILLHQLRTTRILQISRFVRQWKIIKLLNYKIYIAKNRQPRVLKFFKRTLKNLIYIGRGNTKHLAFIYSMLTFVARNMVKRGMWLEREARG